MTTGCVRQEETQKVMASFQQIWKKLTKGLSSQLEKYGVVQLEIDPMLEETIELSFDQIGKIRAANEKQLFHGTMFYAVLAMKQPVSSKRVTIHRLDRKQLVMIDIGRKYYSLPTLKKFVDAMALFQFDTLQLHFSENEGFRIESERHPELVSEEHLTKDEIRELIDYAEHRFIEVIPDIDTPGHMKHLLHQHPQWALPMVNEQGEPTFADNALNLFDEEALQYIRSVYREYAELFSSSHYFHIGADEFVPFDELENYPILQEEAKKRFGKKASGIECFIAYTNQMCAFIRSLGFTPIVWSDGFYRKNRQEQVALTNECLISYWTRWNQNMAEAQTYLDKGYQVINFNDNYLYYVLGEHSNYCYPTYERVKQHWEPLLFASDQRISSTYEEQVAGTAIGIWADIPEAKTETEVVEEVFFLLSAVCQKSFQLNWGEKEEQVAFLSIIR